MSCAFSRQKECTALTSKKCVGCSFRKSRKELDDSRRKAYERIRSLSECEKAYIRDKYYQGRTLYRG